MAVYVDPAVWPFRNMIMCHCWADTRAELFAMMDRMGVQLKWFQRPDGPNAPIGMDASWEHFDITKSKRAIAVRYGAIETDKYGPLLHLAIIDCANSNQLVRDRAVAEVIEIARIRNRECLEPHK